MITGVSAWFPSRTACASTATAAGVQIIIIGGENSRALRRPLWHSSGLDQVVVDGPQCRTDSAIAHRSIVGER